jgi:hypothetical protein
MYICTELDPGSRITVPEALHLDIIKSIRKKFSKIEIFVFCLLLNVFFCGSKIGELLFVFRRPANIWNIFAVVNTTHKTKDNVSKERNKHKYSTPSVHTNVNLINYTSVDIFY